MRLFIAEKPSVAKALASELGLSSKGEGYLVCGSDTLTWCFGHLLELAEPDEYTAADIPRNPLSGKKRWRAEDLPIIPKTWLIKPKKEAEKQLKIIGSLVKQAKLIVNAGDSDREGQLLIDEVLEYFGNKTPVVRFWVSAHDATSLQRGLANLKDNASFAGFAAAAKGRGRADWLIGMNLSRAYTLRAERGGSRTLLTVGRVQTPTLALVVKRDREIEAFKSQVYYTFKAQLQGQDARFMATWKPSQEQKGLDLQGRLIDSSEAKILIAKLNLTKEAYVSAYKEETKSQAHPLVFSLSDLTLLASNKYGYSATEVLETCQALYETHKLTSYPRTDCAYLPESQHKDAPFVLAAIKHNNPELAGLIAEANPSIKSRTWNDSKVSVHYGIIPTMHKGSKEQLSPKEEAIYALIVRAYLAQFYPIHEYLSTKVTLDLGGECFESSGKVVKREGWRLVYQDNTAANETIENQILPPMSQGQSMVCLGVTLNACKTKPPSHFSEGTLQKAMEDIHSVITEPEHKKMLKDGDGIGTPATRASIIAELKKRNFLEAKGKKIISTTLGRSLIDALPEVVKSPVLTAIYERILVQLEKDPSGLDAFVEQQISFVSQQVIKANEGEVTIKGGKEGPQVSSQFFCQSCGKGLCKREGKKGFWWSCSGYPNCKESYLDLKGQPKPNH